MAPLPRPTPPRWPIAIRPENITPGETMLTIHNNPEPWHPLDYTIYHRNGATLFTVQGDPWTLRQRRIFRDRSGLPLFELRGRWYNSSTLELKLPGARGDEVLLSAKCRVAIQAPRAVLRFRNAVSRVVYGGDHLGLAGGDEDTVVLEVQAQDLDNLVQVVVVEDCAVAYIERITNVEELVEGQKAPFRLRPKWRVRVAQGVDLSLIAVAVVILGQQVSELGCAG